MKKQKRAPGAGRKPFSKEHGPRIKTSITMRPDLYAAWKALESTEKALVLDRAIQKALKELTAGKPA